MESYRDLKVWKLGMELTKAAYVLTRSLPDWELYGLTSQLRRAAASIPANIAEGRARGSTKDFLRHLSVAQGSLAEVETFLILAEWLGYCAHDRIEDMLNMCSEEGKMLSGLQRSLRRKLDS
jgi:four helix bundle protein